MSDPTAGAIVSANNNGCCAERAVRVVDNTDSIGYNMEKCRRCDAAMSTVEQIDRALSELQSGNNDALARLYDLTHKQLYALCYTYFKNRPDSEDALHDSYITIKREIGRFRGRNGFNWMYTVTRNICLNLIKRGARVEPFDFSAQEAEGMAVSDAPAEEYGIMELAERTLGEHEFRVVMLRAVVGMEFNEIAAMTKRIEATVRWQYSNAIKKLRKEYERRRKND